MLNALLKKLLLMAGKFLDQPLGKRIFLTIVLLCIGAQVMITFFFGGDAWQGREVNGHFFFKAHTNSPEHEVSAALFHVDLWLLRSLGCLWAAGMILGIFEQLRVWRAKNSI